MFDFLGSLFKTQLNILLFFGGFVLVAFAIVGGLKDWFTVDRSGRIGAGVLGGVMLALSLGMHFSQNSQSLALSPTPSPSTQLSAQQTPAPPSFNQFVSPSPNVSSQAPQSECLGFSAIPSVKMHVFNGDREAAVKKATDANIPVVVEPEALRNVAGTNESTPAIRAELPTTGISTQGTVQVSGTYEIHANDLIGRLIPQFLLRTVNNGTTVAEQTINLSKLDLMTPIQFRAEIPYQVDQVRQVEIDVTEAGSFGFFIDKVTIKACRS
jgi:hypothetical protein